MSVLRGMTLLKSQMTMIIQLITEAHTHPGIVVDKLITVIVAFLLKFRIVYNISNCAIIVLLKLLQVPTAFNWSKFWGYEFEWQSSQGKS